MVIFIVSHHHKELLVVCHTQEHGDIKLTVFVVIMFLLKRFEEFLNRHIALCYHFFDVAFEQLLVFVENLSVF
mgnify:CR=1 FL=1